MPKQKVIKDIYRPTKVPSDLDAIVIGSGIGGLTTAALLAKAGQKQASTFLKKSKIVKFCENAEVDKFLEALKMFFLNLWMSFPK